MKILKLLIPFLILFTCANSQTIIKYDSTKARQSLSTPYTYPFIQGLFGIKTATDTSVRLSLTDTGTIVTFKGTAFIWSNRSGVLRYDTLKTTAGGGGGGYTPPGDNTKLLDGTGAAKDPLTLPVSTAQAAAIALKLNITDTVPISNRLNTKVENLKAKNDSTLTKSVNGSDTDIPIKGAPFDLVGGVDTTNGLNVVGGNKIVFTRRDSIGGGHYFKIINNVPIDIGAVGGSSVATMASSYTISKSGSTWTAAPRAGSNLPTYTNANFSIVLQAAYDTLAHVGGGVGTFGGKIHINSMDGGARIIANGLVFSGWEHDISPYSQVIIEGDGRSTVLYDTTTNGNLFTIKNGANIFLKDFEIVTGSNAGYAIYGNDTGPNDSCSWWRGGVYNVMISHIGTAKPAVYIKNPFFLSFDKFEVYADDQDCIVFDNTSPVTAYGNSELGLVIANPGAGKSGLKIISSAGNGTNIGMLNIRHYESHTGGYGIRSDGWSNSVVDFIDLESGGAGDGIVFEGTGAKNSQNVHFNGGYIGVSGTHRAIVSGNNTGGLSFKNITIEGTSSSHGFVDSAQYITPNTYDLIFQPQVLLANNIIINPDKVDVSIRLNNGALFYRKLATGTIAVTQSTADSTNAIETTAGVKQKLSLISGAGTRTATTYPLTGTGATLQPADVSNAGVQTSANFLFTDSLNKTVRTVSNNPIGIIYDSTTFANLNGFPTHTSATLSGSYIQLQGGGTLVLPVANTMLDNYQLRVDYVQGNIAGGDFGLQLWMESVNASIAASLASYNYTQPGSLKGRSILVTLLNGSNIHTDSALASSALPTITAGDSISVYMTRVAGAYAITTINRTTGATSVLNVPRDFMSGGVGTTNNTARIKLVAQYNSSNTYTITRIQYSSTNQYQPLIAGIGDSIFEGSYSGGPFNRFLYLIGAEILGGSGDQALSLLARKDELVYIVKPKNVLIGVGINDISLSVNEDTIVARIKKLTDTLTAHGIGWAVQTLIANNNYDVRSLNTKIRTQFAGKYIDVYTATVGTAPNMNAAYNSGDGTHPNTAGHLAMANYIKADTIYQRWLTQGTTNTNPVVELKNTTGFSSAGPNALTPKSYVDSLATIVSGGGTTPVNRGGTGNTSLTSGLIPFGNGTSPFGSNSTFNYNNTTSTLNVGGYNQTNLSLKSGVFGIQSYNYGNAWLYQMAHFDGTNYVRDSTTEVAAVHFAGGIEMQAAGGGTLGSTITWHSPGYFHNDGSANLGDGNHTFKPDGSAIHGGALGVANTTPLYNFHDGTFGTNKPNAVFGNAYIQSLDNDNSWLHFNMYFNGSGYKYGPSGAGASAIYNSAGNLLFYVAGAGTAGGSLTPINAMQIAPNGTIHLGASSTTGYVWTASGADGGGSWQAAGDSTIYKTVYQASQDSIALASTSAASGSFTPTLTGTLNVTGSVTLGSATYIKVGNIVIVSIGGSFTPTATGICQITATLPFTATTTTQPAIGTGNIGSNSGSGGYDAADMNIVTGTTVQWRANATSTTSASFQMSFQYKVN